MSGYPWWLVLLALIGLVALVGVGMALFSGLGDRPTSVRLSGECPVGSEDFLMAVSGVLNAPLQEGGSARLLNNGDEFFPVILETLSRAERTLHLMVYIWEPGRVSDRFFEVLTERARAGVEVRVIVDWFGGHNAPDDRIEALKRAGGKWAWFHPPRFGMLTRLHKRNHRRVIVVDGRVGFTGGAAVADRWLGGARGPEEWRDAMVEVRGCIATNLQSSFTQLWTHVTGEMLGGTYVYRTGEEDAGDDGGGEQISRHINVLGTPSLDAHPIRLLFWLTFRAAQRRIFITTPYFVPGLILRRVLAERARAGVEVRVLVPNEHIDVALIRWASRRNYEELLEAGVRIYEFQPTMIHQKLTVVDGEWTLTGSANMDIRSGELNQEAAIGILDTGFARTVEETFLRDIERAREVDLEEFRRRPLRHRILESTAVLFEEQE